MNHVVTIGTTANLIKLMLQVDPKWVHPLDFDKPFVIPDTGGVEVTVLEANHCTSTVESRLDYH